MSSSSVLFDHLDHRPWPPPSRPWVMTMTWSDLLFAHWEVDAGSLQRALPRGLELDLYQGRAYIGVVPFRMENVGPRGLGGLPARLPGPRSFAELNVRTYVSCDGKERPGVWFFSLDATSRLAIEAARLSFHLPYTRAEISIDHDRDWIVYRCRRIDRRMASGRFEARYRAVGAQLAVRPGSLEHWLTERYCLYSSDKAGRLWRGEIHHRPWPLHRGDAEIELNSIANAHGLDLASCGLAPIFHVARTLDVVAWMPVAMRNLRGSRNERI